MSTETKVRTNEATTKSADAAKSTESNVNKVETSKSAEANKEATAKAKTPTPAAATTDAKPAKKASKPKARRRFPKTKVTALATHSWWKKTSKKKLAEEHSLTEEQIDEIRESNDYREAVISLMVGQRPDTDKFEKWLKGYPESAMPKTFGARMGIDPKLVPNMISSARKHHAKIAEDKAKKIKYVDNPFK